MLCVLTPGLGLRLATTSEHANRESAAEHYQRTSVCACADTELPDIPDHICAAQTLLTRVLIIQVPGLGLRLDTTRLDLQYQTTYKKELPDAYERLLLDVVNGMCMLLTTVVHVMFCWCNDSLDGGLRGLSNLVLSDGRSDDDICTTFNF